MAKAIDALRYDATTGDLTWAVTRGSRAKIGSVAGCLNAAGYRVVRIDGKLLLAHRIAWELYHGEPPQGVIDHANGNKSDNRIENLRVCTAALNAINARKSAANTSGFKGVYRHGSKWRARLRSLGKTRCLGLYDTPEAAAAAYDEAAVTFGGEFARTNSMEAGHR